MDGCFAEAHQPVGDGFIGFLATGARCGDGADSVEFCVVKSALGVSELAVFDSICLLRKVLEDLVFPAAEDEGRHHAFRASDALR